MERIDALVERTPYPRVRAWVLAHPWVGELPWILAVGIASTWVLSAQPRLGWPNGSDWHQYVSAAWFFWDREVAALYPDWRNPLYPFLIGVLGQSGTYVAAGQLVARASVVGVLAGAGLLGRALGGRAAALAAVASAAQLPLLGVVAHWVNHYPLLGALSGLALAAGALAVRSGRPAALGAAGLFGGLALAVDARGLAPAGVAAGCLLLALPGRRLRPALVGLGLGLILGWAPLAWDDQVRARYGVSVMPLARQVETQRGLVLDQFRMGVVNDPEVVGACRPPYATHLDLDALRAPCAEAMQAYNLRSLEAVGLLPPPRSRWLGLGLLVPLLAGFGASPRASALRSTLATLGVFGGMYLAFALGLRWVLYPDRYAFQYVVPATVFVPVAFARVGALAPARVRPLAALVAAALAIRHAQLEWPGQLAARSALTSMASEAVRGRALAALVEMGALDDEVWDCAQLDAGLAVAPRRSAYRAMRPELPECRIAALTPPTDRRVWLVVPTDRRDHPDAASLTALGWAQAATPSPGYVVWRNTFDGPAPAAPDR